MRSHNFLPVLFIALLLRAISAGAQDPSVSWQGDLALISWTETLSDPTAPAGAVPFRVVTGPYLSWLTDSTATLTWEVVASLKGTAVPPITFNPAPALTAFAFRTAALTGLKAGTAYRYQLACSTATWAYRGAVYTFKTLDRTSSVLRFSLWGDTQYGEGYSALGCRMVRFFSDHMNVWNPDLILHIGDLVYGGQGYTLARKSDWYDLFGRMHPLMAGHFTAAVPGNHDIRYYTVSDGTLPDAEHAWVLEYFKDYAVQPANAAGPARPPFYYSFDAGPVHFVGLLSEINGSDTTVRLYQRYTLNEMAAWLEEDLKASAKPWKIAFFHHPNFIIQPTVRGTIGSILTKYKVQMALGGHEHLYAANYRLAYPSISAFSDSGTMMITASTSSDGGLNCALPLKTRNLFCMENISYMQFEITGDTAEFRAIDSTGNAVDGWKVPLVGQPIRAASFAEKEPARQNVVSLTFFPNPANPGVRVHYRTLPGHRPALSIHDVSGRLVRDLTCELKNGGEGWILWDGNDKAGRPAAPGLYLARLVAGGAERSLKLVLSK